jgi:cephalosporin hydroxylase
VIELWRDQWRLYGENYSLPEGRKIVSRCDDDDVLAVDFCERTYAAGLQQPGKAALLWPQGMTYWRHQAYSWRYPGNQFVSLVTDGNDSPHDMQHHRFAIEWPAVVVSEQVGWIWIRHGDAHTSTLSKYRPRLLRNIDVDRTPVNMRAISRAIEGSGQMSGDYREHRRLQQAKAGPMKISEAYTYCGSDKNTLHHYGPFYDGLVETLRPRTVLEVGVHKGASLRAWRHVGYPVEAIGIDRQRVEGVPMVVATAPDFAPVLTQLEGRKFDLIIDDGSHELSDQLAAVHQLQQLLEPGGYFVVEDLQNQAAIDAFRVRGWSFYDRRDSGRYDDIIAFQQF